MWRGRIGAAVLVAGIAGVAAALSSGCGGGATEVPIPIVYVVAGEVSDPTSSPLTPIEGATVRVETAAQVVAVTTDAEGVFILQGVPEGKHRLRAEFPGRVTTITYDFTVNENVVGALVPLFTRVQVDSILAARGAPAWNDTQGLFGLFALKSTSVPLGDAVASFAPDPGGTLVQTGEGKDPIVVVNAASGSYSLSLARSGYVWDGPYGFTLRPGVLTFAAPRARPNMNGFVFENTGGGPPINAATVTIVDGPTSGATSSTSFLGQFSLVGLVEGTYTARIEKAGFLPGLTWPQDMAQDTTLSQVLILGDTLTTWATQGGSAPPSASLGHLAVDARAALGGDVLVGAVIQVLGNTGFPVAQTAGAPALRLDLPPGTYRVWVSAPGHADSPATDEVRVRAGEVTYARIEID